MPRSQFSIRTLLWLTLVLAAFLGGMFLERERLARQERLLKLEQEIKRQEVIYAQFRRAELQWRKKQAAGIQKGPRNRTVW